MHIIQIDTHTAVKALIDSGFSEKQAESIVATIQQIDFSYVASKQDIGDVRQEIKDVRQEIKDVRQEIKDVRKELKAYIDTKLSDLKADIFKWLLMALTAQAGLIVALIKLL